VSQESEEIKNNGFVVIRNFFSTDSHNALVDFVEYVKGGGRASRDGKDYVQFKRNYLHNHIFTVDVHSQLTELATGIFGQEVLPTYSFTSLYEEGGMCPLHIDRNDCRWTIDYQVKSEQEEPWPLRISRPFDEDERHRVSGTQEGHPNEESQINKTIEDNEWGEVLLNDNDAVCYSGTHSWHYRPTPSKAPVDLIFFHFINK
jgi:hypothetical protein